MKKRIILPILATVLVSGLAGCGGAKHEPIEYKDKLASSCQEGVILHAFNWSFDTIKENMAAIAAAGYTTVQTSPVQQPKGGGANWWSLYQPVSLSIATLSSLGNKEDLKEMCDEADKYGVKVVCDIVFNHLATTGNSDSYGRAEVDPEVEKFEPYIYQNQQETFHQGVVSGTGNTTHTYSGLPDLNTSNKHVQERALSLLKECIDVGVDGFRFDAAKHIETPSDGEYASDFWDNTLEVAKEYYKTKTGGTLYAYGEILNDCENGRQLSIYTDKYFNVTDNAYGNYITSQVASKRAEVVASYNYCKKADANKLVLWAESHDTYESSETKPNQPRINRSWAVVASRKDATALYFARPDEVEVMGQEGTSSWESEVVASVNRFHNRFVGAEEYLSGQEKTVVVERYSENDFGAVVVNTEGEGEVKVEFENLPDGDYYDAITGNIVEVKRGKANIAFATSGVVVLTLTPSIARPEIAVSKKSTLFAGSIDVELKATNASEATYQIDDNAPVKFTDKQTVTLGEDIEPEETVTLKIVVKNGEHTKEKVYRYTKLKLIEGFVNVVNVNPTYLEEKELYIWAWNTDGLNVWTNDYTIQEGTLLFDAEEIGATGFLLAIFPKGHVVSDTSKWDSAVEKQSGDIDPSVGFYDASSF